MSMRTLRAWVAVATAIAPTGCSTPPRTAELPTPGQPSLSIATFNVNFGLDGDPDTVAAIPDADIVLLQETTEAWEHALETDPHPYRAFRHCCLAGGLAILSRFPFREAAYVDPPEGGWFPGWVLVAETPLGRLQLLDVHLRPPRSESGSASVVGSRNEKFSNACCAPRPLWRLNSTRLPCVLPNWLNADSTSSRIWLAL